MIPPIATTPIYLHSSAPSQPAMSTAQKFNISKVMRANQQALSPLTSPELAATPAPIIAQSELPGGSTPVPPAPTSPSIRDTGSGYPSSIPRNYFGPAIGVGNGGTGFGVISRFTFGDKYSIRPSAIFGGNGTVVRVPVTYDFALGDKEPFERNPLITFHAGGGLQFRSGGGSSQGDKFGILGTLGIDVNVFEGVSLLGSFNTDFADNNGTNIGLGFEF